MIPEKIKSVWRSMWGAVKNNGKDPPTSSSKLDAAQLFASLSSETLLNIFSNLRSDDMVRLSRVCKSWHEIVQHNKSLWRRLVSERQELEPSVVQVFDRNSGSTLEKVTMRIHLEEEKDASVLLETLQRNKQTLHTLHLVQEADAYSRDDEDGKAIQDQVHQLLNLPNLVDCRNDSDLLRNLSSLVVYGRPLNTTDLKLVLKKSRHTLRHLQMKTDGYETDGETDDDDELLDVSEPQVSDVKLPNLQVLGLSSYSPDYPSWLKIPTTATLVTRLDDVMAHLPAISKLWIGKTSLKSANRLVDRCPELVELRVISIISSPSTKACRDLISVLRQRKENCEAGLAVEGVRMVPLKTLTIDVGTLKSNIIDQMKELVEEVVHIREVSSVIDVEAEV